MGAKLTTVQRAAGWHIHHVDSQADEVAVEGVTPAVLAAALHKGGHHLEGEAFQVPPHHMATVGDQVHETAQHITPYMLTPFLPLLTDTS